MTTVRVLHDHVGEFMKGDIVPDAHIGLVEMAERESINAATGLRLAEIVEDSLDDEYEALRQRAKELKVRGFGSMKFETLKEAVEKAEADAKEEADKKEAEELAALKEKAKELNVEGYEEMDADQLKDAIEKATQGGA